MWQESRLTRPVGSLPRKWYRNKASLRRRRRLKQKKKKKKKKKKKTEKENKNNNNKRKKEESKYQVLKGVNGSLQYAPKVSGHTSFRRQTAGLALTLIPRDAGIADGGRSHDEGCARRRVFKD